MQYEACGAQEPECTLWYMRIPSTAQRSSAPPQPLDQRFPRQTSRGVRSPGAPFKTGCDAQMRPNVRSIFA